MIDRMMRWIVAVLLILTPLTASADALKPEARAKASIAAQIAAFKQGLAGQTPFLALFDPKGVIVGDGGAMTAAELTASLAEKFDSSDSEDGHRLLATLFGALPDGRTDRAIKSTTLGKVTAGGVADAVWFSFELTETMWVTKRFRITELMVERGGTWKIVVAHIGMPRPDDWEQEEESRGGGPTPWGVFPEGPDGTTLARLTVAPTELVRALAKDHTPVVFGTSEQDVAVGHAAGSKLLAGWAKLKLELVDSREQRSKTWGYAVAQIKLPTSKLGPHGAQSMKMRATVFAIAKADGTWQVVVAQYSRVSW